MPTKLPQKKSFFFLINIGIVSVVSISTLVGGFFIFKTIFPSNQIKINPKESEKLYVSVSPIFFITGTSQDVFKIKTNGAESIRVEGVKDIITYTHDGDGVVTHTEFEHEKVDLNKEKIHLSYTKNTDYAYLDFTNFVFHKEENQEIFYMFDVIAHREWDNSEVTTTSWLYNMPISHIKQDSFLAVDLLDRVLSFPFNTTTGIVSPIGKIYNADEEDYDKWTDVSWEEQKNKLAYIYFNKKAFESTSSSEKIHLPQFTNLTSLEMIKLPDLDNVCLPNNFCSNDKVLTEIESTTTIKEGNKFRESDIAANLYEPTSKEPPPEKNYSGFCAYTYSLKIINENLFAKVTELPEYFFASSYITSFDFSALPHLKTIKKNCFYYSLLNKVNFENPLLKEIGDDCFSMCFKLTSITFSKDVKLHHIGKSFASSAISLLTITIPSFGFDEQDANPGYIYIGDDFLSNCRSLTSIEAPYEKGLFYDVEYFGKNFVYNNSIVTLKLDFENFKGTWDSTNNMPKAEAASQLPVQFFASSKIVYEIELNNFAKVKSFAPVTTSSSSGSVYSQAFSNVPSLFYLIIDDMYYEDEDNIFNANETGTVNTSLLSFSNNIAALHNWEKKEPVETGLCFLDSSVYTLITSEISNLLHWEDVYSE